MLDVILDALKDSLITLAVIFVLNFVISFIEEKLSNAFMKNTKVSPLIGAAVGLVPQCGFPIVAADMYQKRHITMGTLLAIFIACSDEALPIMLSDINKAWSVIPLIIIKFILGFIVGFLVDAIYTNGKNEVKAKLEERETKCDTDVECNSHVGCCDHKIEGEHGEHSWIHEHLIHPLLHSLKLFAYILIINLIFGFIIYFVGEDAISNFLHANVWLTPIFSTLVGLIPNCASSVIITEMYIEGSIYFGAALAGLIVNAGLGMLFLFKNYKNWKNNLIILGILVAVSLIVGYAAIAIQLNLPSNWIF